MKKLIVALLLLSPVIAFAQDQGQILLDKLSAAARNMAVDHQVDVQTTAPADLIGTHHICSNLMSKSQPLPSGAMLTVTDSSLTMGSHTGRIIGTMTFHQLNRVKPTIRVLVYSEEDGNFRVFDFYFPDFGPINSQQLNPVAKYEFWENTVVDGSVAPSNMTFSID